MRVHLTGIGGMGMSGIAQILLARGVKVSGSDIQENTLTRRLRKLGARVWIGHRASQVEGAQQVVYSSSIAPSNPELIRARNRGISVLHRGQALALLTAGHRTIAVTGSHGKSTTAALASQLLVRAGRDPLVLLGAEVEALGGNVRAGRGPEAVVEADESDGSFLWLSPACAVVTNIDEEHLDYFRNRREIEKAYAAFIGRANRSGVAIGCGDDPGVFKLLRDASCRRLTYGLRRGLDFSAEEIRLEAGGSRYRCLRSGKELGILRLQIPGIHNLLNSLAAVALAEALGIGFSLTRSALESYRGAKRRFQIQAEVEGILVVEDYAHHPSEIRSTLQAARSWENRRIRCVFQPHRYSRTRHLLHRFAESFSLADELILLPIYAASEDPVEGVTSASLMKEIRSSGKVKVSLRSPEEALERIRADSKPGDMVLFMGAGSVGGLAPRLVRALRPVREEEPVHAA
ncbi:MAG: UDP-N-acetylmuramate--L-alanine ligase [Candidatus Omnitrophica bacterium]|nr:UDP-N-acetylmuramate--L-alanine ligase [Candidatus Omnitrophota bacterium]